MLTHTHSQRTICALVALLVLGAYTPLSTAAPLPTPVVVAEEGVYTFVSPNNGSGPLWCYGCTVIARHGDDLVVSQMETGEDVPLLCNTRWRLLRRTSGGWKMFAEAEGYRQREPCPIAVTADRGLFLYANDSLHPPGAEYLDCEPHLLRFDLDDKAAAPAKVSPAWNKADPYFTDHSYRGFGVDAPNNELLMLNIDAKTSVQHWSHLNSEGETLANGAITFPIRACYPQVALKDRAAHVLAIGDIVEPVEAWREFKAEQTGRKWDYVFRILYYTHTPDIAARPFAEPIEIANVDDTAGHIRNHDLWIAPDGSAYVLYSEAEVQNALLRDEFFPDKPDTAMRMSLRLAVVKDGQITDRRTLVEGTEAEQCSQARFHQTPDGTLYAVAHIANGDPGNYLLQVHPEPETPERVRIPLASPFTSYCLANTRGGTAPSNTIDIFGHSQGGGTMSYAQVDLE